MPCITYADFRDAILAHADDDNVNPVDAHMCLYFSDTPSRTGAHRCLIGTVLDELDITDNVVADGLSGYANDIMHAYVGSFASIDDLSEVEILAEKVQRYADGPIVEGSPGPHPIPWSLAIRQAEV